MQDCPKCERKFNLLSIRDYNDGDLKTADFPTQGHAAYCPYCGVKLNSKEDDTNEHNRIKKERLALLEMTMLLDEHPKEYDGPCLCESCCSYD
jgi:hypothetical protein